MSNLTRIPPHPPWLDVIGFGIHYVMAHLLLRRELPLIRGIVLTNRCNLRCQHCKLHLRGNMDLTFLQVTQAIEAYRAEGGRCLYIEGGEPFLWRDGARTVEDVVVYAHRLGYLTVVVYTNGTFPIVTTADTVFVSIDGMRETHDALRGRSFDRVIRNIRQSTHPSLFVNFTINNRNKGELQNFCEYMAGIPNVRGIFFYFHTPYYGMDDLYIDLDERGRVVRELLTLRRRFNILNSRAGLLAALRNDWRRPMRVCSVFENGAVFHCCRTSGNPELCKRCGYLSYAEIDQTLQLKPSAIWNAWKYF